MLVITGTQRSGTSLVAQLLLNEGYDLGSEWWDEEAHGGYEHQGVCAFYREYLGDRDFPFDDLELPLWQDEEEVLKAAFMNLHKYHSAVKFSYLCMNPIFVFIWKKHRPRRLGDKFLVMRRDARHVLNSKNRLADRFKHDSILLSQSEEALRWNFHVSLGTLATSFPVIPMRFQDLIGKFCINEYLDAIGCELRISRENWKQTVDRSLVHFGGKDVVP